MFYLNVICVEFDLQISRNMPGMTIGAEGGTGDGECEHGEEIDFEHYPNSHDKDKCLSYLDCVSPRFSLYNIDSSRQIKFYENCLPHTSLLCFGTFKTFEPDKVSVARLMHYDARKLEWNQKDYTTAFVLYLSALLSAFKLYVQSCFYIKQVRLGFIDGQESNIIVEGWDLEKNTKIFARVCLFR